MANEVRIALQDTTAAANTNGTWNSFLASATSAPLTFWDNSSGAWTFTGTKHSSFPDSTTAGTGDAAWVDEAAIASENWTTGSGGAEGVERQVVVNVDDLAATYDIQVFCWRGDTGRDTGIRVNAEPMQIVTVNDMTEVALFSGISPDGSGNFTIYYSEQNSTNYGYINAIRVVKVGSPAPVIRKGSTYDVETALGTITTATLNGVNVFDHVTGQVGTTVSFAGLATDEITTSGEYSLVLGDGATTENITVQVNVVGLASFNINKDGADQGSLTDVEFIILTGAAGSRAINQQVTGVTTTVGGDTGTIEITDTALGDGDTITVVQQSPTVGGGAVHTATLGLI